MNPNFINWIKLHNTLVAAVILFFIAFGVYANNLNNQLFWDDLDWISNNPRVHSFSGDNVKSWLTENTLAGIGLKSNYYRPFLFATFTANYVVHQDKPFGYHLVNNLLHAGNAVLVFILLFFALKKRWPAFLVALLFAVHPLQTEAITYIAGRGDPLNVFWMLVSLLAVRKLYEQSDKKIRWYIISGITVVLAILSRETAIIFPFLAMVYAVAFLENGRFWQSIRGAFIKMLPYFVVVFIYGILRLTALNFENTLNFYAVSNPYTENFFVRMYTFMGILLSYAKLLILPLGQHMERGATVFLNPWYWQVLIPVLVLVAILWVTRKLYKKSWDSRTPTSPAGEPAMSNVLVFAFGWFFINLGPTSGITPINALMYEHWLYLAMVGPFTALMVLGDRLILNQFARKTAVCIVIVLAIFGGWLSVKRNTLWGNPIAFFEDILLYEPNSARVNNNLANHYASIGNLPKAEEHYWKAVESNDSFPQPYFNLGTLLMERNDVRGAIEVFEKAIKADSYFPNAYDRLSVIYASQGNLVKAREMVKKFIELQPINPAAYYNLALIEQATGNRADARTAIQAGLRYAPEGSEVKNAMEKLLTELK